MMNIISKLFKRKHKFIVSKPTYSFDHIEYLRQKAHTYLRRTYSSNWDLWKYEACEDTNGNVYHLIHVRYELTQLFDLPMVLMDDIWRSWMYYTMQRVSLEGKDENGRILSIMDHVNSQSYDKYRGYYEHPIQEIEMMNTRVRHVVRSRETHNDINDLLRQMNVELQE